MHKTGKWEEGYFGGSDYEILEGTPGQRIIDWYADFLVDALGLKPGCRVLDCGSGRGHYAMALAKRGCNVTGVDVSEYMIEKGLRLAREETRLTIIKMDFRRMTFRDEFDAVVSISNSLGYGTREDDAEAIRCMVRALKPGGMLLVDLHNLACYRTKYQGQRWWHETAEEFILSTVKYEEAEQRLICRDVIVPKTGGLPREYPSSFKEYPPAEIQAVLEGAGLRDIVFYGDACTTDAGPLFSEPGFNERSNVMIVTGMR